MKITSIEVVLSPGAASGVVKGYASIVFDDMFKVSDCRIVLVNNRLRVVMPDRKAKIRCRACGAINPFNSRFCSSCGGAQQNEKPEKPYYDIVFPRTFQMRHHIETEVLKAYLAALNRSG